MGEEQTVEQEARILGWVPKEEFRGVPERWVDAETFVERGHTIMPLLKKTNERLEGQLSLQAQELAQMKANLSASQEAIQALRDVQVEATAMAVKRARKELLDELRQAKAEGDVDREIEVTEALAELKQGNTATSPPPPSPPPPSATPPDAVHPDFIAWARQNPWFGNDQRKTMRAMGIAQELRADPANDHLVGREYYDRVVEIMEERTSPGPSRVAGSRPSARPTSTGYDALPAEAKEVCARQAKKLVGEGRAFKTIADWQKHYATLYFSGESV